MKTLDFPHCCTAKIVADFGESVFAEGGAKDYTLKEVESFLKAAIKDIYNSKRAAIVATTNSDQKIANKALRNLGFSHSNWMSKEQHSKTKIRIWWISIPKAKKKLKELEAKK